MAGLVFNKCDPEGIKKLIGTKMPGQWVRMRSKIVKILDNFYFKEMKGDELKKHIENAIIVKSDITTMQEIE
jgi:hypothetical protein